MGWLVLILGGLLARSLSMAIIEFWQRRGQFVGLAVDSIHAEPVRFSRAEDEWQRPDQAGVKS